MKSIYSMINFLENVPSKLFFVGVIQIIASTPFPFAWIFGVPPFLVFSLVTAPLTCAAIISYLKKGDSEKIISENVPRSRLVITLALLLGACLWAIIFFSYYAIFALILRVPPFLVFSLGALPLIWVGIILYLKKGDSEKIISENIPEEKSISVSEISTSENIPEQKSIIVPGLLFCTSSWAIIFFSHFSARDSSLSPRIFISTVISFTFLYFFTHHIIPVNILKRSLVTSKTFSSYTMWLGFLLLIPGVTNDSQIIIYLIASVLILITPLLYLREIVLLSKKDTEQKGKILYFILFITVIILTYIAYNYFYDFHYSLISF